MDSKAFICPNCGEESQFPILHRINITMEPRFKEEILNHRLFHFACSCGFEMEMDYPLIYHDMEKKLMVFLMPDPDEDLEELEEGLIPLAEEGYAFRIVRSIRSLCEKILLWDAQIDDHVIEFLKLLSEQAIRQEHPNESTQLYFHPGQDGQCHFIVYGQEDKYIIPVDKMHFRMAEFTWENAPKHGEILQEVNRDWAKKILDGKS